jgi:hypothetical protein
MTSFDMKLFDFSVFPGIFWIFIFVSYAFWDVMINEYELSGINSEKYLVIY